MVRSTTIVAPIGDESSSEHDSRSPTQSRVHVELVGTAGAGPTEGMLHWSAERAKRGGTVGGSKRTSRSRAGRPPRGAHSSNAQPVDG
eukprot:scaffold7714_cov25-Tisochrysis_lutea.AAC.3